MNAKQRREAIVSLLRQQTKPISATALAKEFGVSRQIIVGDIALLRAGDLPVLATPRGYLLQGQGSGGQILRTIACRHQGEQQLAAELYTVVDFGGSLIDVIVEHPIYGQLSGQLQIHTRYDADQFLQQLKSQQATSLSILTNGIHLHTISCPNEEIYQRILQSLDQQGILMKVSD